MELESILKLIDHVSHSDLSSFSLEEGGVSIKMETNRANPVTAVITENAASLSKGEVIASLPVVDAADKAESYEADATDKKVVKSPLVGVFYSAPAPDADDFVSVGDDVSKGQTLGIIEAMKLMNEIESEYDGRIQEILVNNGDMVEYGQPLFIIE